MGPLAWSALEHKLDRGWAEICELKMWLWWGGGYALEESPADIAEDHGHAKNSKYETRPNWEIQQPALLPLSGDRAVVPHSCGAA